MIKTSKAWTDDHETIDSPRRHIPKAMLYNTIQFKNLNLNSNFRSQLNKIWVESASSRRRQRSPSFEFPKAQRFSSPEKDERKNRQFLKLDIVKDISNDKSSKFGKALRNDNFKIGGKKQQLPSPATYFLQNSPERHSKIRTLRRKLSTANNLRSIMQVSQNFVPKNLQKGVTIGKFYKTERTFIHHGRNMNYQPEITQNNPGVGKYNINYGEDSMKNKRSTTIGTTLKKFNQYIDSNPGAGTYLKEADCHVFKSQNQKGTLSLSQRTYLKAQNPEEYTPAPNYYNVKRFLQK